MCIDTLLKDALKLLLLNEVINLEIEEVLGIVSVNDTEILRNGLVEDKSSECGEEELRDLALCSVSILKYAFTLNVDILVKCDLTVLISKKRIVHRVELSAEKVYHAADDPSVTLGINTDLNDRIKLESLSLDRCNCLLSGCFVFSLKNCLALLCLVVLICGNCLFGALKLSYKAVLLACMCGICKVIRIFMNGQIVDTEYHIL